MKDLQTRSTCPISYTLDLVGDKWALLILRDIMFYGKSSYSEFLRSDEKISTNILQDKLEALEQNGLVTKKPVPGTRKKSTYLLTEKGIDLLPLILEMNMFGSKYNPPGEPEVYAALQKDKEGTISAIREKLRSQYDKPLCSPCGPAALAPLHANLKN